MRTMKFSLVHANRLRKIARHLRRGRLAHKRFDFSTVNETDCGKFVFDHCGHSGCALGEFHVIFPRHFQNQFWVGVEDAEHFLALSTAEAKQLFVPGVLRTDATPAEVAAGIIKFLKSKGFSE